MNKSDRERQTSYDITSVWDLGAAEPPRELRSLRRAAGGYWPSVSCLGLFSVNALLYFAEVTASVCSLLPSL